VSFSLAGVSAGALVAQLGARRIGVRDVQDSDWVRVSCGFFTTEGELDAVVDVVAAAAGGARVT
jgi:selenocysteine lyase/cysteine desulfurase